MNKIRPLFLTLWLFSTVAAFGLGWMFHAARTPGNADNSSYGGASGAPTSLLPVRPSGSTPDRGDPGPGEVRPQTGLPAGSLSPEDMKAAMKDVTAEKDPLKRAALFAALLEKLTPENARDAFLALKESSGSRPRFGPGGGGQEMQMLLTAWGRADGPAVIAELTALRDARAADGDGGGGRGRGRGGPGGFGGASGDGGGMDFVSALSGWATADVKAAAEYVDGLDDERTSRFYTAGLIKGVLVNGTEAAMDFLGSLPEDNEMRGRYTAMVASQVLEEGMNSARAWAEGIQDPELKGGALSSVAREYTREDLAGAVQWVSEHAGQPYAGDALARVASEWASQDPQATLDWAASLPENTQAEVFSRAFDEWTEKDAVAASEYLANMQPSPTKDHAVEGFASELARDDPESAIAWAQTIGDQDLRTQTLTRVAQSWARADRSAALSWLEASGLPPEAQQAVQEPPRFDFDRGGRRR